MFLMALMALAQSDSVCMILSYGVMSGVRDIFVLELDCVAESIAFGVFDVTFVCAVMLW